MSIIGNPLTVGGTGGVDGLNNCLRFSSPSSFTLKVYDGAKHWDGSLEWTDGVNGWKTWNGTTVLSASEGFLALRGTGNSVITGGTSADYRWSLTGSDIRCDGNIETLLDYATVAAGNHPQMGAHSFNALFFGCTSLTTAPVLPATTLANYCYAYMFYGCTSLTTAPALPATTLAYYCYPYMFSSCTSLTTAPALPATTLANYCYNSMFSDCTSLRMSQSHEGDYQCAYRIPTTGSGTTATSALDGMFSGTGGTFTGTPSINTTYYTTNPPIAA